MTEKHFVGRGDAIAFFEDACRECFRQGSGSASPVISFYGIKGVGKTALLGRLKDQLSHADAAPVVVDHNFRYGTTDPLTVMILLRNEIIGSGLMDVTLSDFAVFNHAIGRLESLTGNKYNILPGGDKPSPLSSPFLDAALEVGAAVPILSYFVTLFKAGTNVFAGVEGLSDEQRGKDAEKQYAPMIRQINGASMEDLMDSLPLYFAADLRRITEREKKPLVFILDSYEKMTGPHAMDPSADDQWIWGPRGLIRNIPYALWVISGCEKLTRPGHEIRSFEVTPLDEAHSALLLERLGVREASLREYLFDITDGHPAYMRLCAEHYQNLREKGLQPTPEDFSQDRETFVERFLSNYSATQQNYLYAFTALIWWTDEIIEHVIPNFSDVAYEKMLRMDIISEQDGRYQIHRTITKLIARCARNRKIYKNIATRALRYFLDRLGEMTPTHPDYSDYAIAALRQALVLCETPGEFLEFYHKNMTPLLTRLAESACYSAGQKIYEYLYQKTLRQTYGGDTLLESAIHISYSMHLRLEGDPSRALAFAEKALALVRNAAASGELLFAAREELASAHFFNGNFATSLEMSEVLLREYAEAYGPRHPKALYVQFCIGVDRLKLGDPGESARTLRQVLDRTGEQDPDFRVRVQHHLSVAYDEQGDHARALELKKQVLTYRREKFGPDHPITMKVEYSTIRACLNLREYQKAIPLCRKLLSRRIRVLGPEHLDTLRTYTLLGQLYTGQRDFKAALEAHTVAVSGLQKVIGSHHFQTFSGISKLIGCLIASGSPEHLDAAKQLLEQTLPDAIRVCGGDSAVTKELRRHHAAVT